VAPRYAPLAVFRRPLYAMLLPIPVVCFVGAVVTDLAYQASDGNRLWANFSSWLIAAGLLFGAFALVVLLVESIRSSRVLGLVLLLAAWIVELLNSFVHARDGWTAVVPIGLILSIVGAILVLVSGWLAQPLRDLGARP
jgi:uncharacterized membrane protein